MSTSISDKRHRYSPEVIAHALWLYHRFPLSLRHVEEMLLARGTLVSYETIRRWSCKFGPEVAASVRRRAPRRGDVWHLDEMQVKIGGKPYWLWRAVDAEGYVLDEVASPKRDKKQERRLLVRCLKGLNNRAENSHRPLRRREKIRPVTYAAFGHGSPPASE